MRYHVYRNKKNHTLLILCSECRKDISKHPLYGYDIVVPHLEYIGPLDEEDNCVHAKFCSCGTKKEGE